MMIKQLDLVERRLLRGETIPHEEKIFSLFEPHTQWINKGKLFPPVELGHKVLLTTDQHELILDYKVMDQLNDADEVIALADRLLGGYGSRAVASLSFDKGFSRTEDRQLLELYIPEVIMPKRGKRNSQEQAREHQRRFVALRRKHSAIESDINCLEHHGLDRCPDKGLPWIQALRGFWRAGLQPAQDRPATARAPALRRSHRESSAPEKARFVTSGRPKTGKLSSKTVWLEADQAEGNKTGHQKAPKNRDSGFREGSFLKIGSFLSDTI